MNEENKQLNSQEEVEHSVSDADVPVSTSTSPLSQDNLQPQKNWYVLRVQSGKEDKVRKNLIKRITADNMSEQIPQVLVPTEFVSEIRKGFKRVVERKLYPGYVMVEMELNDDTHYLVRSTPGVGDIAGTMTEGEAERMLLSSLHTKDKPIPKVSFYKGQVIRIKEGAFANYDGIVDEVNDQKGKVKVRVEIFGRHTQVELGYWQVETV